MVTTTVAAHEIAAQVLDPELPLLTLADLGVLREVSEVDCRVVVTITPTYSGCPAMQAMRDDLTRALQQAGHADVQIRTSLSPAWSTDWITAAGREKLAAAGIAPPGAAPTGPVPLTLLATPPAVACPQCGSGQTEETSHFGPTACTALHRCRSCDEPFQAVKPL